jgi:putative ABC transport system permease protein
VIGFFRKLTIGHFRRHRLEALLCLVGVALGVAVVVAIDAAVTASVSSFSGAVESMAERSTHSVFAESGTIPDQVYIDLLNKRLPIPLAPVIDRGILVAKKLPRDTGFQPVLATHDVNDASNSTSSQSQSNTRGPEARVTGDAVLGRLIGVDVFSERSLRSFTKMQSTLDETAFRKFLAEPGQVVLVDQLAKRLGVQTGSTLQLTVGSRRVEANVVGIIEPTGMARSQLTDILIADLATAQELTDSIGQIDRIDTVLENPQQEQMLAAALPTGYVVRSTSQRAESLSQLIQSYRLNLHALSLMASFVAVFIVYNSMLISVQQRATSLGILRCLGGSRTQLAGIYLTEALLFAAIGGAIGVLGGWGLSRILVGYVSTTINDLYGAVRPSPVTLDAAMWIKGLALSLGSCLVGSLVPLLRASRTPPVNAFRSSEERRGRRWMVLKLLVVGIILLAISYGVYLLPGQSPIAGFAMAFLVALGFAFVCPWVTRWGCNAINAMARRTQLIPMQMAATGVARSLGITGVAVAATMLAMAMNVGVRTMVTSFRNSLADWMGQRFAADVFVAPELLVNHKIDATLDPRVLAWVRNQPEVAKVSTVRSRDIPLGGKSTLLTGTEITDLLKTLPMKSLADAGAVFDPQRDALVSEPLAGRMRLSAGDSLGVPSPTGVHRFHVFGIFYDFGTERGQLMIERSTYAADWRDEKINSLHVNLKPGFDRAAVTDRLAQQLRRDYPVEVHSFDFIKDEAMNVFDRTFKVTEVLTWLSGGVAFCGLAGSLLALALARRRDYSILAAVGMSGRQTAAWVLGQGVIIAWASALVAPVAGTLLAYVLAYVIQYRSFGWSIPTHPHPEFWMQNFLLATIAALVAAVYPIYRLRSTPPAVSLRPE